MSISPLVSEKEAATILFSNTLVTEELQKQLLFLADILSLTDAFISFSENEKQIIQCMIGLENYRKIGAAIEFEVFDIEQNIFTFSDTEKKLHSYTFFNGFPLVISKSFVGTLCLFSNSTRVFTEHEGTIISHVVHTLETLVQLHLKNQHDFGNEAGIANYNLFASNSSELLWQMDVQGNFSDISKNALRSLGYERLEFMGQNVSTFIHPDDLKKYHKYVRKIKLNKNNKTSFVYRFLHKNGDYVWHSVRYQLRNDEQQLFYIVTCTDITEFVQKQQKLEQQNDFYTTILNYLPTDVVSFDLNHKYQFINPIGVKNVTIREFLIGKDDFDYAAYKKIDTTFAVKRRENFNIALKTKKAFTWDETLVSASNETTHHIRKFTPVYYTDGSFKMMIGFSIDVTDSKKSQIEILKSRELIKNILNNTPAGIIVQGPNAEIIQNNLAACKLLGITNDQLLGLTSYDPLWGVIHEDGSQFKSESHPVPTVIKSQKAVHNVVMGVRRPLKKDLVWLLVNAAPVFDEKKKLLYVVCSFDDITARKKTEDALITSNDRFKQVTEATSDVIWDWNLETDEIFVGNNYFKKFGHKFGKKNILTSKECDLLVHPDDRDILKEKFEHAFNDVRKNKWQEEYRYLKADGSYSFIKEKAQILRDKTGKAVRMIGAMTDISNEKKLSDNLRASEEKFKGAFEYSSVGIGLVNKEGYWFDANKKLCKILGYSKSELATLTFMNLTHTDDLKEDAANLKKLNENKTSFFEMEKRYITKSKKIVWVNLLASSVKDNHGNILYYLAQIIDITDRKKVEHENELLVEENNRNRNLQLNEVKNMYQLLAENTVDLVGLHNLNGVFEYVSPSVKHLLGFAPKDLIGKSPLDFVHPDDKDSLQKAVVKFRANNNDITSQSRFKTAHGNYIWLETKGTLVKKDGIPVGIQSSTRDITIRREAEESIKTSLEKEMKLNELRTNLVSTISHEFRTPMTTIRTSAELIEFYIEGQSFEDFTKLSKHTQTITGEIDRIVDLMNSVLTISQDDLGKTTFKPMKFDLKHFCQSVLKKFHKEGNGTIKTFFKGTNFSVFADKNLMEYSLFNALTNAFKYSGGSKDVHLILTSENSKILLEIEDFGIGIPLADQENLFNTFYRASNTYGIQGTGLGLYIIKTFTEKNSGTVTLESEVEKGTKISLEFPQHL